MWIDLLWTFFKIGICTFGGGYAMLPILQREIVEKKKWATEQEVLDYYAVGQCTPGIIALNTATFIGYKYKGVFGGILCTLGFIMPSWVIITVLAALLQNFADIPAVCNALAGIRVCVCVLIVSAVVKLWKSAVVDRFTLCIFALVFGLIVIAKYFFGVTISAVWFVLLSGVAGIVVNSLRAKK